MDKNKKKKIIVVGINHAGTTSLKAIHRHYPDYEVVAYDRNDNISFLGCGIAIWVGKEFEDPKGLFYSTPEKIRAMGINLKMRHEMIGLSVKDKTVKIKDLDSGKVFDDHYDKLILGIGSWPILNPGGKEIPGLLIKENDQPIIDPINGYKLAEGIHLSKLYQHAESIMEAIKDRKVKKVAIIGAGYIGIELVEAFWKDKKQVTLIDFENRIMPRYFDEEFTRDLEGDMVKEGVTLALGQTLQSFEVVDGKVRKVITNRGEYEADLVIMAVGFLPATQVLNGQIDLDKRGAIKVNEYFQTSNHDVFAIGDCIAIYSNAIKMEVNIALATNAVRSGLMAGINVGKNSTKEMLGFPGVQGTNAISVFGWKLTSTGLSEVSAKAMLGAENIEVQYYEDTAYPPFMRKNHLVKIKIVWDKTSRKIVGAQIGSTYDHTEAIFLFSLLIMKGGTIDELPLVDLFFLPHVNKPYNYITAAALLATKLLDANDVEYPDPYTHHKGKKN